MIPIVRYIQPFHDIKIRLLLHVQSVTGEMSEMLTNHLLSIIKKQYC